MSLAFTNHPKLGDIASFNHALCGLYAAGLGIGRALPSRPRRRCSPAVAAAPTAHAPSDCTPTLAADGRRP